MTSEDFSELRLFNAHYFLLYYIELGRPLLDFAQKNGLHPISLISNISKEVDKSKYPVLAGYLEKFHKQANSEWFKTVKDADKHYLKDEVFNKLMKDGFPKLNYGYAAQLLGNIDLRNEFLGWIGENIKNQILNKTKLIDELVAFCVQRIYHSPFVNKKDTMELSFECARHLSMYVNDYDYQTSHINKEKKGEYRDLIGSYNVLKDNENKKLFTKNLHKNSKIKLKFDVDEQKSRWLIQEVERNGGANDLSLAMQLIITNNQKAFLRSWSLVS